MEMTPLERYALAFDACDEKGMQEVLQEAIRDPALEKDIVELHSDFDGEQTLTEHLQTRQQAHQQRLRAQA